MAPPMDGTEQMPVAQWDTYITVKSAFKSVPELKDSTGEHTTRRGGSDVGVAPRIAVLSP